MPVFSANCQIKTTMLFVCATMNKPGEWVGCHTPFGKKAAKSQWKMEEFYTLIGQVGMTSRLAFCFHRSIPWST
jgi:hypothetical protein